MSVFSQLPEARKDITIAQFLRSRRPDLFDLIFIGDFLLWTLGSPCPVRSKETVSTAKPVDLRMSAFLHEAVRNITSGMDYTATTDPTWSAILKLRNSNANSFDFSVIGDGLSYYLASLELQEPPE